MISLIENFLTEQECKEIIDFAKPNLSQSNVVSTTIKEVRTLDYGHRNSQDFYVKNPSELINKIKLRIQETTGVSITRMEDVCIIYYQVGEYFKAHHDFFHPNTPNYEECVKNGGNRNLTFLLYLHSPDAGGETCFPMLGQSYAPKPGTLLYWDNMSAYGDLLYRESLHEGMPVIAGEKWIASIWCREQEFKR